MAANLRISKFCQECGALNDRMNKFCGDCGAKFSADTLNFDMDESREAVREEQSNHAARPNPETVTWWERAGLPGEYTYARPDINQMGLVIFAGGSCTILPSGEVSVRVEWTNGKTEELTGYLEESQPDGSIGFTHTDGSPFGSGSAVQPGCFGYIGFVNNFSRDGKERLLVRTTEIAPPVCYCGIFALFDRSGS